MSRENGSSAGRVADGTQAPRERAAAYQVRVTAVRGGSANVVPTWPDLVPQARKARTADQPLEAAELPWVPTTVVDACSVALHRMDASAVRSLAITSPGRGDGRTTVALGAAVVQRNEYRRSTVLLELDLDQPSLADSLGVATTPGVSEFLRGAASLAEVVQWVGPQVGVVVAGTHEGEVSRLLPRFGRSRLLSGLRGMTDVVVADLPPLFPAGPGEQAIEDFTQALLVVRAGRTPMSVIRSAVSRFEHPPPVLLNEKASRIPRWLRPGSEG